MPDVTYPPETGRVDPLSTGFAHAVLADLVATRSVNPGVSEQAIAERIAGWLRPLGAELHFVESMPGRPSLAAVLRGSGGGPTLVLNGHMDTVPVDDAERWTADPFVGTERDGFLYGRGACDMKAGLTAQIAAAHALAALPEGRRADLILHFAAGEECGEPGTLSLCQAGFVGDVGIVTEPTQLQVSVATRGLVLVRIRILGRSVHASTASAGHNPLDHLAGVLGVLAARAEEITERRHPLLGSGSCTPTVVRAGVKENAIADYCELHVDRRLIPGESAEREIAALTERLDALRERDPGLRYEIDHAPYPFAPAEIAATAPFATVVRDAGAAILGTPPAIIGTAYSSDVRNLVNDAGMEAVTFGPGNVAECHCVDERVELAQVADAAKVLTRVAHDLWGCPRDEAPSLRSVPSMAVIPEAKE